MGKFRAHGCYDESLGQLFIMLCGWWSLSFLWWAPAWAGVCLVFPSSPASPLCKQTLIECPVWSLWFVLSLRYWPVLVFYHHPTNCHKRSSLKQCRFLVYSSVGEKSDSSLPGLESRCWRGCVPYPRFLGRMWFVAFPSFQRLPTFLTRGPLPNQRQDGFPRPHLFLWFPSIFLFHF